MTLTEKQELEITRQAIETSMRAMALSTGALRQGLMKAGLSEDLLQKVRGNKGWPNTASVAALGAANGWTAWEWAHAVEVERQRLRLSATRVLEAA